MKKIIDEYTDLPVSRQRKHQLRHRNKSQELKARYRKRKKLSTGQGIDIINA